MTRALAPLLGLLAAAAPVLAMAQSGPRPAPWRPADPARPAWSPRDLSPADAHRLEMDRLSSVADANRDEARRHSVQNHQVLETLRARQAPLPATPPARLTVPSPAPLPPPADPRQTGDVRQIDDWLDRTPD